MDIKNLTIQDVQNGLAKKEFSPEELQGGFLNFIKKENPGLNAYLSVFESDLTTHYPLPTTHLSAVPCAIKDNILIEGRTATAGSKILENYVAPYDATVIKKLKKMGVTFLGKTNLDEFGMGSSTENSAYGVTRNPHDHSRVAGGSSGGSAAAVASGMAVFALGTDTGGSVRLPAAFCGVVGLNPTYGRVSRHGVMAMAASLYQVGIITKTVYDAALVLNEIAGQDPMDSTTVPVAVPDYTAKLGQSIEGLRVGVPKEYFMEGLDPQVEAKIREAINKLEKLGAKVGEATLPHSEYNVAAYYVIVPAEVMADMARYDGIRYGHVSSHAKDLFEIYTKSRAEGFGSEVRRRVMIGAYVLSAGYYDAYYLKAQKVRTLIRQDYDQAFEKFDVLVGPTTADTAFKVGEQSNDPLKMYLEDIYTVGAKLAGLPAISIPCGTVKSDTGTDLPVGLQIIGNKFDEETILRVAYSFEQSSK